MDLGPSRRAGDGRRRSLFRRLRSSRSAGNGSEPLPSRGDEQLIKESAGEPFVEPASRPATPATPAFEPAREPRHVHTVPTNAELKMSQALELFNNSEHPRTMAEIA